jgi:hypothetical protein
LGGLAAHTDSRILFVDPSKISSDVKTYLASVQIVVKPYSDVWDFLGDVKSSLGTEEKGRTEKVFTGAALSWAVELALGKVCPLLEVNDRDCFGLMTVSRLWTFAGQRLQRAVPHRGSQGDQERCRDLRIQGRLSS